VLIHVALEAAVGAKPSPANRATEGTIG